VASSSCSTWQILETECGGNVPSRPEGDKVMKKPLKIEDMSKQTGQLVEIEAEDLMPLPPFDGQPIKKVQLKKPQRSRGNNTTVLLMVSRPWLYLIPRQSKMRKNS